MFLDWIAQVDLLEHDPSSGILKDFPLGVRVKICAQVVQFLKDPNTAASLLTSPAHVRWAMECIGQSFALPIEEADVIQAGIDIYKQWLIGTIRPKPVEENEGEFFQIMFKHYSLVFNSRNVQYPAMEAKHTSLCLRVLKVLEVMGREHSTRLQKDTWECLLHILLGVTDFLMRSNLGNENTLGIELRPVVIRVLFELWLRSKTKKAAMWQWLQNLGPRWCHRMPTVLQWNVTCLALTQCVLRLLYGPTQGLKTVRIRIDQDDIEFSLSPDYLFFVWHRMLRIIGDPNCIQDPHIFRQALFGIMCLVDTFLNVGRSKRKDVPVEDERVRAPQGNTILRIFGNWLFEAVSLDTPMFEEGRALAYEALCRVFCVRGQDALESVYLANFYRALSIGLASTDGRIVSAILLNTSELLTCRMDGSFTLVPCFLCAIERILPSLEKPFAILEAPYDLLRRAAIEIAGTLICLPNHFGELSLNSWAYTALSNVQENPDEPPAPGAPVYVSNYNEIPTRMAEVLLSGLQVETDPQNMQMLLWTATAYALEYCGTVVEFPGGVLAVLDQFYVQKATTPTDVVLCAFECMKSLTSCHASIREVNPETISGAVKTLCRYVDGNVRHPSKRNVEEVDSLIVGAFECIDSWVTDQWILDDRECLSAVLRAIEMGIMSYHEPEESQTSEKRGRKKKAAAEVAVAHSIEVREMAMTVLEHLMLLLSQFPSPVGPERQSTLRYDVGDPPEGEEAVVRRFFLLDDAIVSIIERPYDDVAHSTIVIRSANAKLSWDLNLRYEPINAGLEEKEVSASEEEIPDVLEEEEEIMSDVLFADDETPEPVEFVKSLLKREVHQRHAAFEKLMADQSEMEEPLIMKKMVEDEEIDCTIIEPDPPDIHGQLVKFQRCRLLLGALGLNSLEMRGHFVPLEETSELLEVLKELDRLPERSTCTVALARMQLGQKKVKDVLANESSEGLDEFLKSMSWEVDLSTHTGFRGGLRPDVHKVAAYHSSAYYETVFHFVPSLSDELERWKFFKLNHVHIYWNTSERNVLPQFYLLAFVNIVVYPLSNGLFLVRIYRNNPIGEHHIEGLMHYETPIRIFGPLLDGMVVSRELLGPLVRETAINANIMVKKVLKTFARPSALRRTKISSIAEKFETKYSLSQLYSSFFSVDQLPA